MTYSVLFQCMGWTWYLANDMQLYVLSPLLLIPLFYQEIVGGVVCFLFLLAASISTAVSVMENDFHAQKAFKAVPWVGEGDYAKQVYLPFYTRMGPYVTGIFTGYLLYRLKLKCRIPKVLVLLAWVLSILICMAVVYGPYEAYGNHIFNDEQSTAYEALHRTGWGIAICWIIFACATGNGGRNYLSNFRYCINDLSLICRQRMYNGFYLMQIIFCRKKQQQQKSETNEFRSYFHDFNQTFFINCWSCQAYLQYVSVIRRFFVVFYRLIYVFMIQLTHGILVDIFN